MAPCSLLSSFITFLCSLISVTKVEKFDKEAAMRYDKLLHDVLLCHNETVASTRDVILIYGPTVVGSMFDLKSLIHNYTVHLDK